MSINNGLSITLTLYEPTLEPEPVVLEEIGTHFPSFFFIPLAAIFASNSSCANF
jgi:hypothetical protein